MQWGSIKASHTLKPTLNKPYFRDIICSTRLWRAFTHRDKLSLDSRNNIQKLM